MERCVVLAPLRDARIAVVPPPRCQRRGDDAHDPRRTAYPAPAAIRPAAHLIDLYA